MVGTASPRLGTADESAAVKGAGGADAWTVEIGFGDACGVTSSRAGDADRSSAGHPAPGYRS